MDVLNKIKEIVGTTLLDDDTYCYLMKNQNTLTLNKGNYVGVSINGRKKILHRFIMNYSGVLKVEHID